jgi:nucleoside 2-deoxyribosyltransferase
MMIRTVYLAGGINGLSDADANDWRSRAKELLPRSIAVLDPMARDYRGKEDENVADIVKGDLDDIAQCEAVIAMCPRPSWGTAMEIHHTATTGRDIKGYTTGYGEYGEDRSGYRTIGQRRIVAIVPAGQPVSPWLRHHTDAVVETLEAAVDQVIEWAGVPV